MGSGAKGFRSTKISFTLPTSKLGPTSPQAPILLIHTVNYLACYIRRRHVTIFMMNLGKIAVGVIEYSFYTIFFLVPLIWLPINSELFELNKITVTYILASVIFGAWITNAIYERKLYLKKTPLDIFILLFLIANVLSTIFSIDWHLSFFGYYSRFNGGLLSTFTYIFLYYALTTHFNRPKIIKLLLVGFITSVLVSIYAILQHPNPLFRAADGSFRGIDQGYWDLHSHRRSFSFIGQQNWLAAYLSIFFFIGVSFLINVKKNWQKLFFLVSLSAIFLGFTFTYSRGGFLGFVAGFLTFATLLFFQRTDVDKFKKRINYIKGSIQIPRLRWNWLWLSAIIIVILTTNYFFSNAFSKRTLQLDIEATRVTQLEIEGRGTTEIRFIVWRGALDIFKKYPLLGSGVETFALSYYQFRPEEHNNTIEWDFLYNKAHNEYLNYLSTIGAFGTIVYLALITFFSFLVIRWLYLTKEIYERILMIGIYAAYVSFLIQNVFGFSVVILSLFFFLSHGMFFLISKGSDMKERVLLSEKYFQFAKSESFRNLTYGLTMILSLSLVLLSFNFWVADYYFAKGISGSTGGQVYNNLQNAVRLRPDEPLYLSELAVVEATLSTDIEDQDFSQQLEEDSQLHIDKALDISPNNLGIWRNKLRVFFELSKVDDKYIPAAISAAEKTVELAPTDARLHYNLALFYLLDEAPDSINKSNETLIKVLGWKTKYNEARQQLAKNYVSQGKEKQAKEHLEYILENDPGDIKALNLLDSIE